METKGGKFLQFTFYATIHKFSIRSHVFFLLWANVSPVSRKPWIPLLIFLPWFGIGRDSRGKHHIWKYFFGLSSWKNGVSWTNEFWLQNRPLSEFLLSICNPVDNCVSSQQFLFYIIERVLSGSFVLFSCWNHEMHSIVPLSPAVKQIQC